MGGPIQAAKTPIEPGSAPRSGTRRGDRLTPIVVVGAALLLSFPALFYPLARDAGIFSYGAAALVDGGTPYIDFVDQKPPGIFLLYALPLLFSRTMVSIHLLEWAVIGLTAVAAWRLGCLVGPWGSGFFTAILTGVFLSPMYSGFWGRGQIETFLSLPYALVMILLIGGPARARPALARLFLAGMIGGTCLCLKPNALATPMLLGAVHVFWLFRRAGGSSISAPLRSGAIYAAGLALAPFAAAVWLWHCGALGAFIDHLTAINAAYVAAGSGEVSYRFLYTQIPTLVFALAVCVLLWILAVKGPPSLSLSIRSMIGARGERVVHGSYLGALWVGCLAMLLSGGFLFPYHYQVLVLPGALTVGLVISALGGPLLGRLEARRRPPIISELAVIFVACLVVIRALPSADRSFLRGGVSLEAYRGSERFDFYDFSFREDRDLARAIDARTRPGDKVQVFGHGSLALFLADRESATRFSYTKAAMDPRYGRGGKDREEILAGLSGTPPPLIVVTTRDPLPQFGVPASDRQIEGFAPLASFLARNYTAVERIGDHVLLAISSEHPR